MSKPKTVCMSCGYDGEDIQGENADLYRGYGCPKCHSPLVVVQTQMSLTEKIKRKAKTTKWIEEYSSGARNTYRKGDCTFEGLENIYNQKWVFLEDVLALLDNYMEKWQEIVKLIKNRPPKSCTNHASLRLYYEEAQKWFEVLEAKVAEAAKEEVEN